MIFKISNLDISGKLMRDFFYIVILGMGRIVIMTKYGNGEIFAASLVLFECFAVLPVDN